MPVVRNSFAFAAAALALLSRAATAQVTCDGEGLAIETDLWGVSGATLQSRVPLAQGGPNLVINGDFDLTVDGRNMSSPQTSQGGLVLDPTDVFGNILQQQFIKGWQQFGGGVSTYAFWGNARATINWAPVARDAGASPSCIYPGNYWSWTYNITSGTFAFDQNGYGQGSLYFYTYDGNSNYGSYASPVTVQQELQGLKVGSRYRLQFFQGFEGSSSAVDGVAAFEISAASKYHTIDFVARTPNTMVKFQNWGHININGPQGGAATGATEMGLDDVIITECPVPCMPKATVTPSVIADPAAQAAKTGAANGFTYTVKLACPKKAAKHGTAEPREDAVFKLQLPAGWKLASGTSMSASKSGMSTTPTVDGNGLVTWLFPSAPETLSFKLRIMPTTCISEPNLVGQLCIGNGCRAVTLTKPAMMAC